MTKIVPDIEGLKHQLLDHAHLAEDFFDKHVVTIANRLSYVDGALSPELAKAIDNAAQVLADLYQAIGAEV